MSMSEIKTVINDIINDYNLDIILLVGIVLFGIYTFFLSPLMFVNCTSAVVDGHVVNVTARVSGAVTQSYILKDQEVKKGDLMIEIDVSEYEKELEKLDTQLNINKQKLCILTNQPLKEDLKQKIILTDAEKKDDKKEISNPPKYKQGAKDYTNYSRTYEPEDLAQKNLERKKMVLGDVVQNMSDINVEIEKANTEKKEIVEKKDEFVEIDTSKDTVQSVKKTIKDIEKQKEEIKLKLSGAKIFAPQDGIISGVLISQGDVVNPAEVLCTLIPKQVWILASVNAEDYSKIRIGQSVKITIPNHKHRVFKGTVTSVDIGRKVFRIKHVEQIAELGVEKNNIEKESVLYQIKIDFIEDYSDFNIQPNTPVRAKIQVQSFTN